METINSFDFLIALIAACQAGNEDPHLESPEGFNANIGSSHYLLNQSLRLLWDRPGHLFVTKEALDLWSKLKVGDSIFHYYYQKPVFYKNENPVPIECYKGASKTPYWKGDIQFTGKKESIRFRQVFHREHIVPISIIIEELLAIDLKQDKRHVYNEIDAILNKIYVCYMLKKENIRLNEEAKNKRSDDYQQVLYTDYVKADIKIIEGYTNKE